MKGRRHGPCRVPCEAAGDTISVNDVAGATDRTWRKTRFRGYGEGANRAFAHSFFIFITEQAGGPRGATEGGLGAPSGPDGGVGLAIEVHRHTGQGVLDWYDAARSVPRVGTHRQWGPAPVGSGAGPHWRRVVIPRLCTGERCRSVFAPIRWRTRLSPWRSRWFRRGGRRTTGGCRPICP